MERLNPAPYADHFLTFPEASCATNDLTSHEPQSEPVYHTGIGSVTFEQLYQKTSRTVGYVMRERHGMTNPEDIDDCMQAGYLKVWQQLQKNPDYFADKPKRYLVQAIVFRSKAQRFSHQRYYHKIVYDADAEKQRSVSIMTTDQVDIWIDLEQAISHVAHQVEDKQEALLGLYCLITQATVQDVAATFGYGYSTLTAYKRQVKGELAAALDGYAPKSHQSRVVTPITPLPQPDQPASLVTTRLLEAIHTPSERVIYQAPVSTTISPTASTNGHLKSVEKPEVPSETYATRWGGQMTLEQIITDPQVRRAAYAKVGRLGLDGEDREDCVQQGFIRLWQKLRDNPNLLTDKGQMWVGIYIAYSGNAKQFHRHNLREHNSTNSILEGNSADAYRAFGRASKENATRAQWANEADEVIDTNSFLHAMKQHYANHPRKLIALQAVTGAISSKEAAEKLGLHEKNFAAGIGNQVRQEMQTLLPDTMKAAQPKSWETQLARGEGVEHIVELAQEVMHNPRLLLALYVVTTSASKKMVAATFGYGLTAFGKDIGKVKQMIATKYRRTCYQEF